MKTFIRKYGELPGGVCLLLLTLFQVGFSNYATEQDFLGRILFLEDGYVRLCSSYSQAIAGLKGIDYELRELKQVGVGIPLNVECKFYSEPISQRSGSFTWSQVHFASSKIEKWIAFFAALLFVVGLFARLSLDPDIQERKAS